MSRTEACTRRHGIRYARAHLGEALVAALIPLATTTMAMSSTTPTASTGHSTPAKTASNPTESGRDLTTIGQPIGGDQGADRGNQPPAQVHVQQHLDQPLPSSSTTSVSQDPGE